MFNAMGNWGSNVRETGSDLVRALLGMGQQPLVANPRTGAMEPMADIRAMLDGRMEDFRDVANSQLGTNLLPPSGAQAPEFTRMQNLFGGTAADGTRTMGAVPSLLQGGAALGNLYMGMQNYGLAKDSLKESRRQFDMNYGNQRDATNTYMEDRQRARNAASPGQQLSTAEYMERNRIR